MGTGAGSHALLVARHACRVVATGINPRALNVTAFNALLNGAANVECRQGDFYGPSTAWTFDFVSMNPRLSSRRTRYIYRDSNR